MRSRGYTLIELLISASIMAGVLIAAFTIYAVINRNGRAAQSLRSDSYDGAAVINTMTEYVRYASPWLTASDQPMCTSGLSSDRLDTLQYGVTASSNTLWLAVRESSVVGTTMDYLLYRFSFVASGQVTNQGVTKTAYQPQYYSERITTSGGGACQTTPIASGLYLLPSGLAVIQDGYWMMVGVNSLSVAGDTVGALTLDPVEYRSPREVVLRFMVVNQAQPNRAPFGFATTIVPRDFASEFVAL